MNQSTYEKYSWIYTLLLLKRSHHLSFFGHQSSPIKVLKYKTLSAELANACTLYSTLYADDRLPTQTHKANR